ncbi:AraC family transcriptional regulator [uncultured Pseudoteredinibacter sp.]|uniref:AraC family transcriptional regulator n=1 Tax=uncultured Pseudoteredinibacter sp. TaxID=1641701 RepID=UPI0026070218|nr:AraC family transcriptional regulator [uncultured Pseudoteredinibacter sp.]
MIDKLEPSYLHIPTIPAGFLQHLAEPLLAEERFPGALLDDYQCLLALDKLTVAQYSDFSEQLCLHTQDEWLGLLDRAVPLGSHVALLHLLHPSADLFTALSNVNRFFSLFLDGEEQLLDLSRWQTEQKVYMGRRSEVEHLEIASLMRVLKLSSWLCQEQLPLKSLSFSFAPTQFDKEFAYLFGAWPDYQQPRACIQFHPSVLNKAVAPAIDAEQYAKDNRVHSLLWRNESDLQKVVYGDIAAHLHDAAFSADHVAERLHLSKATLGRRLKEKGSSYSDILSQVRKDKALQYLHSADAGASANAMSIEQLAEALGYIEMASFSRAFKSWFDCSPKQYWQRYHARRSSAVKK